jgi:hypothetical protein
MEIAYFSLLGPSPWKARQVKRLSEFFQQALWFGPVPARKNLMGKNLSTH